MLYHTAVQQSVHKDRSFGEGEMFVHTLDSSWSTARSVCHSVAITSDVYGEGTPRTPVHCGILYSRASGYNNACPVFEVRFSLDTLKH